MEYINFEAYKRISQMLKNENKNFLMTCYNSYKFHLWSGSNFKEGLINLIGWDRNFYKTKIRKTS